MRAQTDYTLPADSDRLAGISILAAEDNLVNQMLLEELLTSEGAQLELASDGQEAVERISANPQGFHLVLMDIQMPRMDGYEATRRILEIVPGLPVVGQTAHTQDEEKARCRAVGMVGHVAKPINLDELVETILHHARARTAKAPATAIIDWPALEARYAAKPGFVGRLLGVFVDSHRNLILQIRAAMEAQDLSTLARLAHSVKGSAGNVLAGSLADCARQAEHAARDTSPAALSLADRLLDELERTLSEIANRKNRS